MHFTIEAHLQQGHPRLRIFDAESGNLRLQWRYRAAVSNACQDAPVCTENHLCAARINLHALMRDLFLLSCAANPALFNLHAAAQTCVHCDRCTTPGDDVLSHAMLARPVLK